MSDETCPVCEREYLKTSERTLDGGETHTIYVHEIHEDSPWPGDDVADWCGVTAE